MSRIDSLVPILDCETRAKAAESVAAILGVGTGELDQWLHMWRDKYVDQDATLYIPPHDVLLADCLNAFHAQPDPTWECTCYFHLTRTLTPEAFLNGVASLPEVIDNLWESLYRLVSHEDGESILDPADWETFRRVLETDESDSWANGEPGAEMWAMKYRNSVHNHKAEGGPFGYVVRELAFPKGVDGPPKFLEGSETVDAICWCANAYFSLQFNLRELYHKQASPCIVKFCTSWYPSQLDKQHALEAAINYLYITARGSTQFDTAMCPFNGSGERIPAKNIQAVEIVDTETGMTKKLLTP